MSRRNVVGMSYSASSRRRNDMFSVPLAILADSSAADMPNRYAGAKSFMSFAGRAKRRYVPAQSTYRLC